MSSNELTLEYESYIYTVDSGSSLLSTYSLLSAQSTAVILPPKEALLILQAPDNVLQTSTTLTKVGSNWILSLCAAATVGSLAM